jgi:PST family polysaccharide transporter
MQHFRRLVGFGLLPALSILASLVLLPFIAARFGPGGWVALAIGQSIGAFLSVAISMAWPVIGGNAVARASSLNAQRELFRNSLYSRLLVLTALCAVGMPLAFMLADEYPGSTVLFMLATSANGLSASWYYAGIGEPRYLVINEGLVRFGGYVVALVGFLVGAPLVWYAGSTVAAAAISVVLNWRTVMGTTRFWVTGAHRVAWQVVREQLSGTLSRMLLSAYTFGGPAIFGLLAPSQLALFSAAAQIQKAGNNTVAFLPPAFVHWVGSAMLTQRRRRIQRSLLFLGAVSVSIVPGWLFLGPSITDILYAGKVQFSWTMNLLLGLTIAGVLLANSLEVLLLVPLGQVRTVYRANSILSVLGLLLLAGGAVAFGALGGLAALAVVQGILLTCYLVALLRRHQSQKSRA